MLTHLRTVMSDTKDRGASAVEYGLMVAAIAAVIVAVVFGLGTIVQRTFRDTCTSFAAGVTEAGTSSDCGTETGTGTGTGTQN
ncbi:Flp family type IVb pilin [Kineosporia succinea]|uniref:Pilus assembly protein Flp/PilA n=1 Tax=Kineosporia succinea TaxID=84632 RepID=A0ABT9P6D8_9ACTN|nr:Flp family type IVb pilin [Kineosporia succinea]MDP9828243.1 pilus assembly protein Flp/PilA [Kineosporia succinea]